MCTCTVSVYPTPRRTTTTTTTDTNIIDLNDPFLGNSFAQLSMETSQMVPSSTVLKMSLFQRNGQPFSCCLIYLVDKSAFPVGGVVLRFLFYLFIINLPKTNSQPRNCKKKTLKRKFILFSLIGQPVKCNCTK